MKRLNSIMAVALASAGLCSVAIAQDRPAAARGGYTSPQTQDQRNANPAQPSNENMDANAQRAHSPSATRSKSATDAKTGKTPASPSEVRNWQAIDSNHDGSISPDEMEAYLSNSPQSQSSSQMSQPSQESSTAGAQQQKDQQQTSPSQQSTKGGRVAP